MSNPREKAWSTAEICEAWDDWRTANFKPQWIKCSERMPGNADSVLIWSAKLGRTVGFWDGTSRWWETQYNDPFICDAYQPTHWQPLPEPPND